MTLFYRFALGLAMVALALPASAQTTQTYCSGTPVMIPASGATSGAPDPYPTTITVSGLAGAITDVDVSIAGLSHSNPGDLDVFVEAPNADNVWLFSDQANGTPATDVDVVFDDQTPGQPPIPFSGPLTSGSYIPANVGSTSDAFDAPAPTPSGSVRLSDFNGDDPNGTWTLWSDDDATNNTGEYDEWCVIITTDASPNTDPTSDTVTDGASFDVEIGSTYSATYAFSDADGDDTVTVTTSDLPAGFSASPTDGNPATVEVAFTPEVAQANQSYTVTFTATDGNGGSTAVDVTYNVGDAPVVGTCAYSFEAANGSSLAVDPEGGQLRFTFSLDNSTSSSAADVDLWARVETGEGTTVFTRAPRPLAVPAEGRFKAGYNQRVPASIPDGAYTYTLYVGDYNEEDPMESEVCGSRAFQVTKGTPDAAKAGAPLVASDWASVEIVNAEVTSAALTLGEDAVRVGPNPVRGAATFAFTLAADAEVSLVLYDVQGREVATVTRGAMQAGAHTVALREAPAPGVYVWQLRAGERVETGRLTVIR
ncbi:MAG TPA: T9SS type A sorting domain-containing protein [Bacteroidetes bacterium]|nr:T9SS type A sorting domain-containing protein [Bacteroidota bacterium]